SFAKDAPRNLVRKRTGLGGNVDLGLKDRVAIVAASSKGLGLAVATELAREGAEVAICSRNAVELEKAAATIEKASGRPPFWKALDVTKYEDVRQFVTETNARLGPVAICVTNAGGPPSKKFLDTTIDEWRAAVDTNLMSATYFAREVLPKMRERHWGRLITITSMTVKQPLDGLILSNSIRAAVTGLAKTLANEFGADGITVNNVCPGYTATERLEQLADKQAAEGGLTREQVFERMSAQVPEKRIGTPEEFAALVTFLASERASYINGTTIAVDGGWIRSLL
ncbi:MAG TPA: SDR family oxidoreductase, partial [Candidatus Acidoferrales bacterium]|nr:SDR family oxidoreductase [Candidatus Acidoferrales bacterium]